MMLNRLTSFRKASRYLSTLPYQGNNVLGIVREGFSQWERRSPLCPHHVKQLVKQGTKVLVQPCTKRIFTNKEFAAAGAVIQEDLSDACLVIGVKQMPIDFIEGDKNYMFFSHVIKAQPKNMPLLDRILEKKARIFDYECITKGGLDDSPRLVAFGKYAGIAGMIDCLQGLGQRLLAEGYSTPFLNMPLSYMFPNLDQARVAIRGVGSQIEGSVGLPDGISPLVFAFTGNGNVAKGAREMFELLPHEWISVDELPTLKDQVLSGKRNRNRVYGVIVEAVDMVAHPDGKPLSNKADYYANPQNYVPIFHEKVAPYASVLVNCMYWDSRYPRLLTNSQIAKIRRDGNKNLRFLADITCDVGGSVEFLVKSTMIEKPFYSFSPESGTDSDELNGTDIGIAGVDILPSELPRDASEHFGNALMPLLPTVLKNKGAKDVSDMADIPPELRRACIASHGELQPKWKYIELLRQKREQQEKEQKGGVEAASGAVITKMVEMRGHLFDSGLINRVLDLLDGGACPGVTYAIQKVDVNPNTSSGAVPSVVTIALTGSADALKVAEAAIAKQFESTPSAAGKVTSQGAIEAVLTVSSFKKVVLFGSGRVSRPTLKLLGSHDNVHITIATDNVSQADELRSCLDPSKTSVKQFRLPEDADSLDSIMKNCDLAISLLPATMHLPLAEAAIRNKKHLVTSSYVSPQMRELHDRAVGAGITLMNEVGLDPGIDHMLIMKAIDDIHHRGGVVDELVSLCGGLPDPVAANNPLRYKFSWSPRGVLNAAGNSASYLSEGKIIQVPGEKLLLSAVPSPRFPTMRLETLPNRDSLLYKELYHIPKAKSICRGTLRYEGWSNCMYALKVLGTMDITKGIPSGCSDWKSLLLAINPDLQSDGAHISMDSLHHLLASRGVKDVPAAVNAIKWLGLHTSLPVSRAANSPMDAICDLLESRLKFGDTEKDMVAMYHTVIGTMPDGSKEEISSSLLAFGVPGSHGDSAMAATVGYTAGAAAELLLLNKMSTRGVVIPTIPEVYNPLLNRLSDLGITWSETVTITKTRK